MRHAVIASALALLLAPVDLDAQGKRPKKPAKATPIEVLVRSLPPLPMYANGRPAPSLTWSTFDDPKELITVGDESDPVRLKLKWRQEGARAFLLVDAAKPGCMVSLDDEPMSEVPLEFELKATTTRVSCKRADTAAEHTVHVKFKAK